MVKCKLIFRELVLDDKVSTAVMKSLLDAIDIFENSGGSTIDRDGFLDALVDGINICKVNNAIQMTYLNWLIYDSIQVLEGFNDNSYDDLERVTRKTLTYLMKLIEADPEASKAYISFEDISSDGELTLILEDHKMSFKGKIDKDVREMFLETNTGEHMNVSLREHLAILGELDNRFDGLLDYPQIIMDILNRLDRKIENKNDIKRAVAGINLHDYLLREDLVVNDYNGDEYNKNNMELLVVLAAKLMETMVALQIHRNDRVRYVPLPVDAAGICVFIEEPYIGNINVEEIGLF